MDVVYVLPWILFKIPLVRDFLLWSGAIRFESDWRSDIIRLLRMGKSVAYAPGTMEDMIPGTENKRDELRTEGSQFGSDMRDSHSYRPDVPPNDIFEYAKANRIPIVPVLIRGETERYRIVWWKNSYINRLQRYTLERIGWPIPTLFFTRWFGSSPPPPLKIEIGNPMDITVLDRPGDAFMHQFSSNLV